MPEGRMRRGIFQSIEERYKTYDGLERSFALAGGKRGSNQIGSPGFTYICDECLQITLQLV
jgi:hypothetical protein